MPTYQEWVNSQNQGRAAAQKQLPNAQMAANQAGSLLGQANNPGGNAGGFNMGLFRNAENQNTAAQANLGNVQSNIAQFDPNSPENQVAGRKYQAYDLANAGINRIANDPTDQFIRQSLQTAATPGNGPYDATTRNAMFTGAMESSGNKAQVQSIMDSAAQRGLTANDPGVQAALRQAQGQQAQAGQRARLGIDTVANPANYAAQQSGLNRLGDYNTGKQNQQQSAEDRLRQMLIEENTPRAATGPQVAQVSGGNMPQQRPVSPLAAPAATAPAPAKAPQQQPMAPAAQSPYVSRPAWGPPPPPTQQQLQTPWNAQNLNPFYKAQ